MEDLKTKTGQLKDHVSDYAKTTVDLIKAKATKGASNAAAGVAIGVVAFLLAIFFLTFLLIALGWWLASLFGSAALGFLGVAGFLLLLLVLIFALRKKVIVPLIRNAIISKVYEQQSH
jgi:uncharacterized membrane protein YkgB